MAINDAIKKLTILQEFMVRSRGTGTTTCQLLGIEGDFAVIFVHNGQPERHYVSGILNGLTSKRSEGIKFIDINQPVERIQEALRGRQCPMIVDHGVLCDLIEQSLNKIQKLEQELQKTRVGNDPWLWG